MSVKSSDICKTTAGPDHVFGPAVIFDLMFCYISQIHSRFVRTKGGGVLRLFIIT